MPEKEELLLTGLFTLLRESEKVFEPMTVGKALESNNLVTFV